MDACDVSNNCERSNNSPDMEKVSKPRKRSMVERQLETNLTAKITSPLSSSAVSPGSITSRYGRAIKLKTDGDYDSQDIDKTVYKSQKSPRFTKEKSPFKCQPQANRMHSVKSPLKSCSPELKGLVEMPLKNRIDTIYNENMSLSRFGKTKDSPKKTDKVYVRKDLIQSHGRDRHTVSVKHRVTLAKSPYRSSASTSKHLNNILERSSEKYSLVNTQQNGYFDTLSVVKALNFDSDGTKKSVAKEESKMTLDKELADLEAMCDYQVGDIAWARVGNYPFWPCIVSRDPYSSEYVKRKALGRGEKLSVHVIFFGDNGRRGWIADNMMRKYSGLEEFETAREQFSPEAKKKDPKLYAAYFVSEKKSTKWKVSVEEAESLLKEPKRLRLDILNDMLIQSKGFKTTPKREKGVALTRKYSDVSLSESLYDSLFSEDDSKLDDLDRSRRKVIRQSLDVSQVVTACLDNMAAKTGLTKIQKQSHMDRWLQKAKSKTPEKVKTTNTNILPKSKSKTFCQKLNKKNTTTNKESHSNLPKTNLHNKKKSCSDVTNDCEEVESEPNKVIVNGVNGQDKSEDENMEIVKEFDSDISNIDVRKIKEKSHTVNNNINKVFENLNEENGTLIKGPQKKVEGFLNSNEVSCCTIDNYYQSDSSVEVKNCDDAKLTEPNTFDDSNLHSCVTTFSNDDSNYESGSEHLTSKLMKNSNNTNLDINNTNASLVDVCNKEINGDKGDSPQYDNDEDIGLNEMNDCTIDRDIPQDSELANINNEKVACFDNTACVTSSAMDSDEQTCLPKGNEILSGKHFEEEDDEVNFSIKDRVETRDEVVRNGKSTMSNNINNHKALNTDINNSIISSEMCVSTLKTENNSCKYNENSLSVNKSEDNNSINLANIWNECLSDSEILDNAEVEEEISCNKASGILLNNKTDEMKNHKVKKSVVRTKKNKSEKHKDKSPLIKIDKSIFVTDESEVVAKDNCGVNISFQGNFDNYVNNPKDCDSDVYSQKNGDEVKSNLNYTPQSPIEVKDNFNRVAKNECVEDDIPTHIIEKPLKKIDDPEFLKFVELRQDSVLDENPDLSINDLMSYLYESWSYEQKFKSDEVKNDDLQQLSIVKDLEGSPVPTVQPKKVRKRNKVDKEYAIDSNEQIIPKEKSVRRKVAKSFYTEVDDDSDSDVVETASPISGAQQDDNTELDTVEYYFSQLTVPKPNVFKGFLRERVCEICEKPADLVKCKGPCARMFHVKCAENEIEPLTTEHASSRGRKKKKPRGRKSKSTSELNNSKLNSTDSESQSDDKSQDTNMSVDDRELSIGETEIATIAASVEDFEAQIAAKMKEILENTQDVLDDSHYVSEDELDWNNSVAGQCEIVDVKLKPKVDNVENSYDNFKCKDCQKYQTPLCFVCKLEVSPKNKMAARQRCHVPHCHKYYHLECLEQWPQTQYSSGELTKNSKKESNGLEAITCPRHVCHTCVCDDPRGCKTRFSWDKLAKCVRCPAVYHTFTQCLPAGTQILSGSQVICPRHYEHSRPGKVPCHVNTGWCFICALGGTLICCEYCPTSFHAECLKIKPPEGGYMCEDCETGRLPLYGEMVWVKLGHYRWWPGLILHPAEIPENIMSVKHSPGEFVVRFFGQYDHYWVNRGRVFPFQEGDSGRVSSQKSKIDEAFTRAMEDAQRACEILKAVQPNSEESLDIASSLLPPHYIKLKVNKPCGSLVSWRRDASEANSLTQCECDPEDVEPCGADSQCLNRVLLTECGPTCRAGDRCNNRLFEKRQYPKLVPYRTPHRGWGLKTLEDIRKGQFVIEYVGELIDEEETRRRMTRKHEMRDENFYFLTLDKDRMIDAGPKGNLARFMNHCCEPNCETQKWTVLGDVRVGLFAINHIPANSEVNFNYNLECAGIDKKQCMCGAKRCSGYIGAKPKQDETQPKRTKLAKRVYKKRTTSSLDSPSTSRASPKPRSRVRVKPRELTEIEKDLLIIKNATNGMSSDSESERTSQTAELDGKENSKNGSLAKPPKRRRSYSAEDALCRSDLKIVIKKVKLDGGTTNCHSNSFTINGDEQ